MKLNDLLLIPILSISALALGQGPVSSQRVSTGATFTVDSVKLLAEPARGQQTQSIKPGRVHITAITLAGLVDKSYGISRYQFELDPSFKAPDWVTTQWFAIEAVGPDGTSQEDTLAMLRDLMARRFKLVVRQETREVDGYELHSIGDGPPPAGPNTPASLAKNSSGLADVITTIIHQPTIDKTNLVGTYDFRPGVLCTPGLSSPDSQECEAGRPSIFDFLKGINLSLERKKVPWTVFVLDHVEKPNPDQ